MWVLYTHVFWYGESFKTTIFTLQPSRDPFVTHLLRKNRIFHKLYTCAIWVLYTHVFWYGESFKTTIFTLRPSRDQFVTTPMPYPAIFMYAKIEIFINYIVYSMPYGYDLQSCFWHSKTIYTIILHSDHHVTHAMCGHIV